MVLADKSIRRLRMPKPADLIDAAGPLADLGTRTGILPRQRIKGLIHRKMLRASTEIEESQLQPASLDLRLGSKAYRVRASFLPGKSKTVEQQLAELKFDEISLENGAVLERGCVYVVELLEHLKLPDSVTGLANPKSSTGRLDIFTRLIADHSEVFDTVRGRYDGKLYAEISPCSFAIRVRKGTRLNQIRFRRRNSQHAESQNFTLSDRDLQTQHDNVSKLVDGDINLRNGLVLSVDLAGDIGGLVGYRAQRFAGVIDLDEIAQYNVRDFWEPIHSRDRRLILDPHQFYILASKEHIHIPPLLAAEMVPIDHMMGEFRVHYAGFFDPGFGFTTTGHPGSRAVLEVRSHEVPFVLEDGQAIGRLVYENLTEEPDSFYGQTGTSNYQGQGLRLSKHFRLDAGDI